VTLINKLGAVDTLNVVDATLDMSENDFLNAEMLGKHIDKPVAGMAVAGWPFEDGIHLKVRPDVSMTKAKELATWADEMMRQRGVKYLGKPVLNVAKATPAKRHQPTAPVQKAVNIPFMGGTARTRS
jgi:hypothetical protein